MRNGIFPVAAAIVGWLGMAGFAASPKHDIHISYCQAEITATSCKARVTYYRDDFQKALTAWRGGDVNGLSSQEMKSVVTGYIENHFRLMNGSEVVPWKWILKGEDGSSIWFELRAEPASKFATMTIEHTTLFKEFNDQMNLMVLKAPGTEYNFIFTSSKPTASVTL